ncbi:Predicted PurR-regulated permease PerM [Friedmanniella luteola]|uniref:Predicted PurR-regulated permease PerM n=1 Tax=Friedmanniella luteola TaxID=546871 RepID=A0A1H1TV28_9ACTN|nr:AI-2E family transporter [Friedmanniella luteola]SDS64060.1 Predicted PurR-regulated permease PerM [Friedmanniella luteola]
MTAHGASTLGSQPGRPVPDPAGRQDDQDGGAPAPTARRRLLNQTSPFRIGFVGAVGVILAYALAQAVVQARSIIIVVVVAFFIALGLNPLVRALTRRGVKRGTAVLLVLVGVVVVFALALLAVVPVFVEQIGNLVRSGPGLLQDTLRNPQVNALNERYQVVDRARDAISSGGLVSSAFGSLLGAGAAVLSAVVSGFTLLILSLYFLVALPAIKNAVVRLTPASRRDRSSYLSEQIFLRISSYISGTFVVALIAGVLSYVFLLVVGLSEYALALAVLVAVLDIIPLIGATLAAVVVVIIGFSQSVTIGIAALIFYALYQQFENYVVQPRVFKKAVDVPGALVVIAALVGGSLLGIVGALLSVPVAAVGLLILREVAQPRLDAS